MARAPRRRLTAAAAAVLLAACRPAEPPGGASVEDPGPASLSRPARLAAAAPAGGEGAFLADMTHPGMTPVVVKASETAPGRYEADLSWTMAGDWVVTFEARYPGGGKAGGRRALRVSP